MISNYSDGSGSGLEGIHVDLRISGNMELLKLVESVNFTPLKPDLPIFEWICRRRWSLMQSCFELGGSVEQPVSE
jgi:hypothetical protein